MCRPRPLEGGRCPPPPASPPAPPALFRRRPGPGPPRGTIGEGVGPEGRRNRPLPLQGSGTSVVDEPKHRPPVDHFDPDPPRVVGDGVAVPSEEEVRRLPAAAV